MNEQPDAGHFPLHADAETKVLATAQVRAQIVVQTACVLRSLIAPLLFALWPVAGDAAVVGGYSQVRVTEVFTYAEYGGGDVIFKIDSPLPGCAGGIWMRPTDPGFKQTMALLLTSQARGTMVSVWAHDDQLWSGSSDRYCRLYGLRSIS